MSSGRNATRAQRRKKIVEVTLSPEALAALEELAGRPEYRGHGDRPNRSAAAEGAILAHRAHLRADAQVEEKTTSP